jgi:hypothetical protein
VESNIYSPVADGVEGRKDELRPIFQMRQFRIINQPADAQEFSMVRRINPELSQL